MHARDPLYVHIIVVDHLQKYIGNYLVVTREIG
jgi:hypothetical protein